MRFDYLTPDELQMLIQQRGFFTKKRMELCTYSYSGPDVLLIRRVIRLLAAFALQNGARGLHDSRSVQESFSRAT